MKFSRRTKYFLRGMGFGILVTVVLFSVALVFYEPITANEQETAVNTEELNAEETLEETKDTETEEASDETGDTEETKAEETSEESENTENKSDEVKKEETTESTSGQTEEKTTSTGKVVTFKITGGESSYKVAENLYRAGLIDNPSEFNTYLEQNGYDNTIHVGSFNIPEGATYEQIANTISK